MIRVLLHLIVLPVMFWFNRRYNTGASPLMSACVWYLLGAPLMLVEAYSSSGPGQMALFLQSLMIALFFVPPAYFAFSYSAKSRSIFKPLLLFMFLSIIAGVAAGLVLARAPIVSGFIR